MTETKKKEKTRIQLSTSELSALCDGSVTIAIGENVMKITPDDLSISLDRLVQGETAEYRNGIIISA